MENGRKPKSYRRTAEYRTLERALRDNLDSRGLVERIYQDKIREYMDPWVRRQELEADIAQRGVTVLDEKRGVMVENRSVTLELQTSRQMLAIYNALGFGEKAGSGRAMQADDEL